MIVDKGDIPIDSTSDLEDLTPEQLRALYLDAAAEGQPFVFITAKYAQDNALMLEVLHNAPDYGDLNAVKFVLRAALSQLEKA